MINSVLLLIAIAFWPAAADAKPKAASGQAVKKATQDGRSSSGRAVQDGPFDSANYRVGLPPSFEGIGTADLIESLASYRTAAKKDEYETTAQFQSRVDALQRSPLVRNINFQDAIALSLSEPQIHRTYDADRGLLTVEFVTAETLGTVLEPRDFSLGKSQIAVELSRRVRGEDAVFQNAFGAKWQGRDVSILKYIAILPAHSPKKLEITLPQSEATALRGRPVAALLVGHAQSRSLITSSALIKATIDNPTELFVIAHSFQFAPAEVWLYDVGSGRVLHREGISVPPLSRLGVELWREDVPLAGFSVLTPATFKRSTNMTNGIMTETFSAVSPSLPVASVVVVVSHAPGQDDRQLDPTEAVRVYMDGLGRSPELTLLDSVVVDETIAGAPAKGIKAHFRIKETVMSMRGAAFRSRPLPQVAFVIAMISSSAVERADTEADRIIESIATKFPERASSSVAPTVATSPAQSLGTPPPQGSGVVLGVNVAPVTAQVATVARLPRPRGAFVVTVQPNSVGSAAGLRVGDVLVRFGATEIQAVSDLQQAISASAPGQIVELTVFRGGREEHLTAKY